MTDNGLIIYLPMYT